MPGRTAISRNGKKEKEGEEDPKARARKKRKILRGPREEIKDKKREREESPG